MIDRPFETPVLSTYGAPMGRRESPIDPDSECVTFTNVPIDSQGYDQGGAYWGIPSNLFCIQDSEDNTEYMRGRESDILAEYPGAVFEETRWTLYWHSHDCTECGECRTSPSEWADSAICDCGAYIEAESIFDTETESIFDTETESIAFNN